MPSVARVIPSGTTLKRLLLDVTTVITKSGDRDHAVLYRRREWAASGILCSTNLRHFSRALESTKKKKGYWFQDIDDVNHLGWKANAVTVRTHEISILKNSAGPFTRASGLHA